MLSRDLVNSLLSNLTDIKLNPLDDEGYSINAISGETLFLHLSTEPSEFLTIYSVLARTDDLSTSQQLMVLKGLLALNQPVARTNNTRVSLSNSGLITLSLNLEVNYLQEQLLEQNLLEFINALSTVKNQVQQLLSNSFNLDAGTEASFSAASMGATGMGATGGASGTGTMGTDSHPNRTPEDDFKNLFTQNQPILWG